VKPPSLRLRVVALVFLAAGPGLAALLYAVSLQRADERASQRRAAEQAVLLAATQQQRLVDTARGLLDGFASHPSVAAFDRDGCERAALWLAARQPHVAMIGALEPAGNVFCGSLPTRSNLNLADRPYVRRALARGGFAVGDFQLGRLQGMPTIAFALPLLDQRGQARALVFASFDLRSLDQLLAGLALPAGVRVSVTDGTGALLAEWPASGLARGSKVQHTVPFSSVPAVVEFADAGGQQVWQAVRPIDVGGRESAMFVLVTLPAGARATTIKQTWAAAILIGLMLLTVVLAAYAADAMLVKPIDGLRLAAGRIAAGESGVRAALGAGMGELSELGRDFDQMAASLETLSRQHRLVLASVGEGIVGLDREGRVTFSNQAAERLLGYDAAEWLGSDFSVRVDQQADAQGAPLPLTRTLQEGVAQTMATEFVTRSGRHLPVEALCTPIREAETLVGAVVSFRDVTERHALEAQLRQAQKMDAIGRLAGGIAHDFNNLLTVIAGHSEMILLNERLPEPVAEEVRAIADAAASATRLTRRLLAFSRRQILQPRVINPNDLVASLDRLLGRVIGEDVTLRSILGDGLWSVRVDPGQMEQVLLNLAVNARDAMPHGGTLTIETSNVFLDDAATLAHADVEPGPYVMLAVSDTGVGMDAATVEQVFEPFFTTKDHGTGLGLATVHGIVRQSGGYVWVHSEVGRGSTFTVFLPKADGTGAADGTEGPVAPAAEVQSGIILVVEDSQGVRELTTSVLQRAGYTVHGAPNGEEGLRLAGHLGGTLDLLVTDVVMPGMGGWELAERIVAASPRTRTLFISGYTADAAVRTGLSAGGSAFLEKPFTPNALLARVREQLAGDGTTA
jgi:PAS domain S-box-containing protein